MSEPRRWRLVRAGTDAVPASVRWFRARARPRRARRVPPWAPVGAGVVAVVLVGWALWASPLLSVDEVRVTGTGLLTPAEVRQAAAVPRDTPLLRVRTAEVAERVATLGPVAQARVRRAWPGALVVEVVERTAVAVVRSGAGFSLVDGGGVVFHPVGAAPPGLPLLDVAAPGPDDPATRAALVVLAALTPPLRAGLETLTVAGPAEIRLGLRAGRTVVWGDETASHQKAQVATALLDQAADVIDVSVPEVVVLR
jgi:cell division protein FtsQ